MSWARLMRGSASSRNDVTLCPASTLTGSGSPPGSSRPTRIAPALRRLRSSADGRRTTATRAAAARAGSRAALDAGRSPMTEVGVAAIEHRVRAQLEVLGIEHELLPCDPEFADTAAFCAHYGHSPESAANTIVVAARREHGVACA